MILAGGTGTRLWPYSRSMTPKQFLNLGSTHESLFQETCRRLETLIDPEKIYVVGSASHEGELQQQMAQIYPDYRPEQLLIEPLINISTYNILCHDYDTNAGDVGALSIT